MDARNALNLLAVLFALYIIAKHGRGAWRFLRPSIVRDPENDQPQRRESRAPYAMSFINTLIALALLAGSVNLLLRELFDRTPK